MYGTVAIVSADNPASNGFKESSVAYRPCHQCMATLSEMRVVVNE